MLAGLMGDVDNYMTADLTAYLSGDVKDPCGCSLWKFLFSLVSPLNTKVVLILLLNCF